MLRLPQTISINFDNELHALKDEIVKIKNDIKSLEEVINTLRTKLERQDEVIK